MAYLSLSALFFLQLKLLGVKTNKRKDGEREMLGERIQRYLDITGSPMTKFCKRIGISTTAIYRYIKGDLRLSMQTETKIKEYLQKFNC